MLCLEFNIGSTYAQNDNDITPSQLAALKLWPIGKTIILISMLEKEEEEEESNIIR